MATMTKAQMGTENAALRAEVSRLNARVEMLEAALAQRTEQMGKVADEAIKHADEAVNVKTDHLGRKALERAYATRTAAMEAARRCIADAKTAARYSIRTIGEKLILVAK